MKSIDPRDFAADRLFKNLQGNILKGHGRDHTTHIFVRFNKRQEKAVKSWISDFADVHITSFKKQIKERDRFKKEKVPGSLFVSFFLTAEGYKYFGAENLDKKLPDERFLLGMKADESIKSIIDPEVKYWEREFREEIHAMILLADGDQIRMGTFARDLLEEIDRFCHICSIEYGNSIRNANGDGLEHFGYVDGVSQPLFLKDEVEKYREDHNVGKKEPLFFDPEADTDLVLVKDPYDPSGESYGSYFVFRKLEQNVQAFKKAEEDLKLGELGGAYIVGRFEDGTPVVMDDDEDMINSGSFNNFNYKDDPSGGRCPHFAHIRKTNPRADLDETDHKSHIMARRGIPFGHRNVDTAVNPGHHQLPKGGVGLLFMSYQSSIVKQFQFIQASWANNPKFPLVAPSEETNVDLIIGHPHAEPPRTYLFPQPYDSQSTVAKSMAQFVTMKGGEYFFTPGISYLKSLKP